MQRLTLSDIENGRSFTPDEENKYELVLERNGNIIPASPILFFIISKRVKARIDFNPFLTGFDESIDSDLGFEDIRHDAYGIIFNDDADANYWSQIYES